MSEDCDRAAEAVANEYHHSLKLEKLEAELHHTRDREYQTRKDNLEWQRRFKNLEEELVRERKIQSQCAKMMDLLAAENLAMRAGIDKAIKSGFVCLFEGVLAVPQTEKLAQRFEAAEHVCEVASKRHANWCDCDLCAALYGWKELSK